MLKLKFVASPFHHVRICETDVAPEAGEVYPPDQSHDVREVQKLLLFFVFFVFFVIVAIPDCLHADYQGFTLTWGRPQILATWRMYWCACVVWCPFRHVS